MTDLEARVRRTLCEVLENPECETVDDRADLAPYGLNSMNSMCFVIALEGAFDIEVPEDKLGMRFVRNVYDICKLVGEVRNNPDCSQEND